jgi:hypothetical protein
MLSSYQYYEAWPTIEEDGSFHCEISYIETNDGRYAEALTPNTTYYYIAMADIADKTVYGEMKSFTTLDITASVDTTDPTEITSTTATISGSLTVNSVETLNRNVRILYSDTSSTLGELIAYSSYSYVSTDENGQFTYTLSNLSPETTYYYVVCARVGYQKYYKEFYSEVKSFTTAEAPEPPSPKGTETNPYTPSEIAALILGGNTPEEDVYIKGVVSAVLYTFSASYGTGTFWISDDGRAYGVSDDKKKTTEPTKDFECYSVYWLDNMPWVEGNGQISVGDVVVICGKTMCYNGTAETSSKKAWVYSWNSN